MARRFAGGVRHGGKRLEIHHGVTTDRRNNAIPKGIENRSRTDESLSRGHRHTAITQGLPPSLSNCGLLPVVDFALQFTARQPAQTANKSRAAPRRQ